MWKKYDIRCAETGEYFGTVETETPLDAAIIHFDIRGIRVENLQLSESDPPEVIVENRRYKIVEDND